MSKRPRSIPDGMKRAEAMRNKAMAVAMKRKEEYLGARVPKELKARVISRADELGIPVSLLIRKVLEDAFLDAGKTPFVEQTISPARKQEKYSHVLGWKSLELNQARVCERCQTPLSAGSEVFMGITASDDEMIIICKSCKQQLLQS